MSEHEPAARSVAVEAVIRTALVHETREYRYGRGFTVETVQEALDGETTARTVRRALNDAQALGWVRRRDRATRWEPGPKAAEFVDEDTDISV